MCLKIYSNLFDQYKSDKINFYINCKNANDGFVRIFLKIKLYD